MSIMTARIVPPDSKRRIQPPLKKRKTAKQNSTELPTAFRTGDIQSNLMFRDSFKP